MEISKKIIVESLNLVDKNNKTFSSKKQNVILSESQLENLLKKLKKDEHKKTRS